jgi:transposase
MATPLPEVLWNLIEPLLPAPTPKSQSGRPCLSDCACLQGVWFVLRSEIPWRMLTQDPSAFRTEQFKREIEKELNGQETDPWEIIYFV